ncbi:MAG: hypothetical protein VW226_13225 [Rhodospirillaceae bacterium]
MFHRLAPERNTLSDIYRVEALVRSRYGVGNQEIVLVSQDRADKPGFPRLETNVIFFKNDIRYRLKVFKPVAEVTENEIPLRWLLPSLEDTGELDCC